MASEKRGKSKQCPFIHIIVAHRYLLTLPYEWTIHCHNNVIIIVYMYIIFSYVATLVS